MQELLRAILTRRSFHLAIAPTLHAHVPLCARTCDSVYITDIAAPLTPFSRVRLLRTSSDSAQSNNGARKVADARHYNYTRLMIRAYAPIKIERKGCFYHSSFPIELYLCKARTYRAVARLKIPHLSGFFLFRFPPSLPLYPRDIAAYQRVTSAIVGGYFSFRAIPFRPTLHRAL